MEDQDSDIRLSSRLLGAATLICGGFAVAATVSFLRMAPQNVDDTPPKVTQHQHVRQDQARLEEFQVDSTTLSVNVPQQVAFSDQADVEDGVPFPPEVTRVVARGTGSSNDQGSPESGVYVPVTVHPVTVTVDGSAFAEQLSKVASGMDEMLAVQRDVLETQIASRNDRPGMDADWSETAGHDGRLDVIDSTLKSLTQSVDSLRTESRSAVSRLTKDLEQAEMTSGLLQEFRETLAQHRQFLADSSRSTTEHVARIAQRPDTPVEAPLSLEDESFVPTPTDAEPLLWEESPEETQPEELEVPLPADSEERVSSDSESDLNASEWSAVEAPTKDDDTIHLEGVPDQLQSVADDQKLAAVPTGGTMKVDSLHAKTEGHGFADVNTDQTSRTDADQTAGHAKPVMFEQTFSFSLPPTENLTAEVRQTGTASVPEAVAEVSSGYEAPLPTSASAEDVSVPAAGLPIAGSPVLPPKKTGSTKLFPKISFARQVSDRTEKPKARKQAAGKPTVRRPAGRKPARNDTVARGIDAITDFGGDMQDRAAEVFSWNTRRSGSERRTTESPQLLHRLGSAIRSVGRSPVVE